MKNFGLFVTLALALTVSAAPQKNGQKGNQGQQAAQQGQQGQQNGQNGQNNQGQQATGDPQTSLTLDPKVIASNFAQDGQANPDPGQVPSLTSTNNFINFCLTVPNTPITNGEQVQSGSCNPAPIGVIPSIDNMPSSKFTSPKNLDDIAANTPFTVSMAVSNLQTGNFVNANLNYFAAPQQVGQNGQIIGHTHVTIEQLTSVTQTTPTNPKLFAFFKGVNSAAQGGIVTADVDKGLPAGAYRMCSINTSANHAPAIVPVAQHGSLDDCVYFTVGGVGGVSGNGQQQNGQQNNGQQNNGQQNNGTVTQQQQQGQQNGGQTATQQQQKGQQRQGQQQKGGRKRSGFMRARRAL
jgi:hypothetical protein